MKKPPEQIEAYRASIFHPPGQSGLLSRALFGSYVQWLRRLFGSDDPTAFKRSLVALVLGGSLLLLLISGNPGDVYRIFTESGYEEPSEILAFDQSQGKFVTIAEFYRQGRKVIHLKDDPSSRGLGSRVAKCFIAAEDNHFLSHFGVDLQGILRAALVNLREGGIKEGASTITQQVARLRFLNQERSFLRKIREAFYAVFLELRYSKAEILELYLNEVHLGHGANGVESAARFYFNKGFLDLSWGEAALLSSLTTRPRDFSPLRNIEASRRKVQVTFQKLIENGELSVAEAEREYAALERDYYRKLNRSPWDSARNQRKNDFPYVTEFIRSEVLRLVSKQKLLTGGLRIYTTIIKEHQAAAEEEFIPYLKKQTARRRRRPFSRYDYFDSDFDDARRLFRSLFPVPESRTQITRSERDFLREFVAEYMNDSAMLSYLVGSSDTNRAYEHYLSYGEKFVEEEQNVEGGLISLRPVTGEITAIVGGSGFASRNQLMRFKTALRQPGSSFKPLVYSSCMDYSARHPEASFRLTPATMIEDAPVHFVNRDLSEYSPENYSHSYEGWMRLRRALYLSKNSVAVQVYRNCGPGNINPIIERLLQLAKRRRGQKRLPREAAVALGAFVVSPWEMARAYASFVSQGREVHPYIITHITDSKGNILFDFRKKQKQLVRRQILMPATARIIVSMLRDVVTKGTGRGAFLPGRRAAGKTGTTNRNTNAWFVGFTPRLVTALYIGYDTPVSLGPGATGGGLAAPVWGRYMNKALKKEPAGQYDFGKDAKVVHVEICKETGALPRADCSERMVEMFLPGTQPTSTKGPYDEYEYESSESGQNKAGSSSSVRTGDSVIRKSDEVFDEDGIE